MKKKFDYIINEDNSITFSVLNSTHSGSLIEDGKLYYIQLDTCKFKDLFIQINENINNLWVKGYIQKAIGHTIEEKVNCYETYTPSLEKEEIIKLLDSISNDSNSSIKTIDTLPPQFEIGSIDIERNKILFLSKGLYSGHISCTPDGKYYFSIHSEVNSFIFDILGITDKLSFCKEALGYIPKKNGAFPYLNSKEDVITVLKALENYAKTDIIFSDIKQQNINNNLNQKENEHIAIKLQRPNISITRGTIPTGNPISYCKNKIAISIEPLGFSRVISPS